MKKFVRKNKKGFTLTEMIVVIAIIGILAAVMIPSVVIYVNKARQNAAYQQAVAVLDFYEAYNTELEGGLIQEGIDSICEFNNGVHDFTVNNTCKNNNGEEGANSKVCNVHGPAYPGDNVYEDFNNYYEEMTGKKLDAETSFTLVNDKLSTFVYVADNGIKVTINIEDMSATYESK